MIKVGKTCFLLEVCWMKKRKKTGTVWSDKRKIAHIKQCGFKENQTHHEGFEVLFPWSYRLIIGPIVQNNMK